MKKVKIDMAGWFKSGPKGSRSNGKQKKPWGVRPTEWYDKAYESVDEYQKHYSESVYYFIWTVIADRMLRSETAGVLEMGCGSGQFAAMLRDKGVKRYLGVDFSAKAVEIARRQCPEFEFRQADVFQSDVLETFEYDHLVTLEFLEHVQDDLKVIERIKPGTKVLATVPNFPYTSHVRHFTNEEEVRQRYQKFFSPFRVDAFLRNPQGETYFLMEGIKL